MNNKTSFIEDYVKINCHISILEKVFSEFKLQYNKQSVKENLIERAIETTIQILYDKRLFDGFPKADKVSKDFFVCYTT